MDMRPSDPFRAMHLVALGLCLVLLPWSTALLSMAQFLLVGNWIAWGVAKKESAARWSRALGSAPVLVFTGFLAIHAAGLLWTSQEGMSWGISLVRTLMPVLVFAVVLGGSPRLRPGEFRGLLLIGTLSVIVSTFACIALRGMDPDYRQISAFISHIRLALLLCFSIAVLLYYFKGPLWRMVLHVTAILWCLFFIDLLGSIQAMAILLVLGLFLLYRWSAGLSAPARWTVRLAATLPFLLVPGWLAMELGGRLANAKSDHQVIAGGTSAGGEPYAADHASGQRENGVLVWDRIAWAEVERTWYLRSSWRLDSLDGRGHRLYPTLFRYLASKDLPKDSVGIMSLSDAEIARIQSGIPNHLWGRRSRLRDRSDEILFELEQYFSEGRVSGHSLTMRLEFWRAGWAIFKRNWLTGVGTGDTQVAFNDQYDRMQSGLSEQWRLRAHNQYLTLLISFGLFGAIAAMGCVVWPAWRLKAGNNALFLAWAIIIGIGSFTDDTIETQAGATFFALHYALLVFAAPRHGQGEVPMKVASTSAGSTQAAVPAGGTIG
jgi:hypothetical protein